MKTGSQNGLVIMLVGLGLSLFSGTVGATDAITKAGSHVDFDRDIRPILSENCYKCHGPDDAARKAKLRFDIRAEALKPAKSGDIPIVPGSPEKSQLVSRITTSDIDDRMPPVKSGKSLKAVQIDLLRRWVAEGGTVCHALVIRETDPSTLAGRQKQALALTPIDRFILARLEKEGLKPSQGGDDTHCFGGLLWT